VITTKVEWVEELLIWRVTVYKGRFGYHHHLISESAALEWERETATRLFCGEFDK